MLQPRIPVNPLPTGTVIPLAPSTVPTAAVEPVACHHDHTPVPAPVAAPRTTLQLTPGSALALAAGGGTVVLVVGAVLVSMLLAVAITGVSVALIAVMLRLVVRDMQKGR
ncbi:SpdD-like protein [Streptomyces sp. NPDC006553]|uniref:SpdD-like protein n=1 Tax=Streptomyces sp. NPDC006553 TaxID=3157180 RepID=UPI0033A9761F